MTYRRGADGQPALRTLARELGWTRSQPLGDRCPKHTVVGTHASRLARRGRR